MSLEQDHLSAAEQLQRASCLGVATSFTIVSILVVALRIYVRSVMVRSMGKDDWAMLGALLCTMCYLGIIWKSRADGLGVSGSKLRLDQMENLLKETLGVEIIYYILVSLIKISIVCFYLRIATEKRFRNLCKGTIIFIIVLATISIVVVVTQCIPLHKMWDLMGMVQGKCINSTAFFYSTSSIHIVIDLWILALPIKTLMGIQRPAREKYALVGVFALGVFSTIASIVRLHSIRIFTESKDPFYDSVPVNLWSMVEVNIGIWCASIPALKALIVRRRRGLTTATGSGAYKYHSKDKSSTKTSNKPLASVSDDNSFDMKPLDVDGKVVMPGPAQIRKDIRVETTWSPNGYNASQERIFYPSADAKV